MEQFSREFIERANKLAIPKALELESNHRAKHKKLVDAYNKTDKAKEMRRKYEESDSGKKTRSEINKRRREKEKKSKHMTSAKEMELIEQFYKDTPEGYCVDHIIPLASGGLHVIENLQYLTMEENFKKGSTLDFGKIMYVSIKLDMKKWDCGIRYRKPLKKDIWATERKALMKYIKAG